MKSRLWLSVIGLLGCATTEPSYQPPPLPPAPIAQAPEPARVPSGLMEQDELLRLMASDPLPDVTPKQSRKAIQAANARSIIRPKDDSMKRSVVIYPYHEGALYEIATKFRQPTDLVFSHPEAVTDVNKDDDWWDVVVKPVGEEPNLQWHVVITPKSLEMESTMQVFTNRAVYYLHVISRADTPMIAVRWKHPAYAKTLPKLLNPGIYYTGYDVETTAGTPVFVPEQVWDTGLGGHTLIKLPERARVSETPALFVLGNDDKAQLTNWQARGDWYVVNRLFNRAELRLGHTGSEVVRIRKGAEYRAVWCPAPNAGCPEGVP